MEEFSILQRKAMMAEIRVLVGGEDSVMTRGEQVWAEMRPKMRAHCE